MSEYHDAEWGSPSHDDKVHFEFLILEAAQAGLSWLTVLKKREQKPSVEMSKEQYPTGAIPQQRKQSDKITDTEKTEVEVDA